MSKDGQDDKNVNNDKEKQKDSHDLQVLNDIGSIIAQMTTNDPDELRRLVNQAQGLKSDNPRIQNIIERVQSIGTEKQKAAEERSNSAILQEYEKKLEQVEKQRQREEEVIKYKMSTVSQIHSATTTYEEFKKNAEEYRTKCLPLKEMVKVNKKGEQYAHEAGINENILLHEEIEERRQKFKELKDQKAEIEKIVNKANQEKARLDNIIAKLTEKLKDHKLSFEQKQELEKDLKANQEKLEANNDVITEVQKIHENIKSKFSAFELIHNQNKEKIDKLDKIIKENKINLEPEKHKDLNRKHALLKEQHEAIVDNKKIDEKNKGERKEIRSKVEAVIITKNMRDHLDNKKYNGKPGEGGRDKINKDNKTKKKGRER